MNRNTHYDCHGFHPSLPKGKCSGGLHIDGGGLSFIIDKHVIRIPFEGLKVSSGGASMRLVFFKHDMYPEWDFYTADRTVLQNKHLKSHPTIASKLEKAHYKRLTGWVLLVGVAVLSLLAPALLVFRMDLISEQIAQHVPAKWEEKLGESVIAQYKMGKQIMPETESEPLLLPLVTPLIDALGNSPYSYAFYIANEGTLNAFALPGGQIVVHSGLILRADAAEELLGVLAHEIIHVEEQHGIRNVIGAAGIYAVAGALLGDVSGILAILSGAAPLLLNQSYSRRFETESDVKGHALLVCANINPRGLSAFFGKLLEEEQKKLNDNEHASSETVQDALQFLSTHPATQARMNQLLELDAEANTPESYRSFDDDFEALQNAVRQWVGEEAPQDKSRHTENNI